MKRIDLAVRRCAAVGAVLLLGACGGGEEGGAVQEPVPMPDPAPIDYPVELWDLRVTGETEVMLRVNEYGDVDSAMVSKSSGYAAFDSAAIGGARRLRFTPGRRGDRHVPMWTRIPVRFAQDSTATLGEPSAAGPRDE